MTNHQGSKPQPSFFISHGGGPCFWMDWGTPNPFKKLAHFFKDFQKLLPQIPDAILVISAHWEESEFTIQTHPSPPMLFDYYGFPAETYKLNFPAKTSDQLIQRTHQLFKDFNITLNNDTQRGYDHGVFVPFLLMYPNADIPVVQLSLKENLDPKEHYQMGQVISQLKNENILIIGSGLSYHNLRQLNDIHGFSKKFDDWLWDILQKSPEDRKQNLIKWENAPNARLAHPREDHLIPLLVTAGSSHQSVAERVYHEQMINWKFWTSSFKFD